MQLELGQTTISCMEEIKMSRLSIISSVVGLVLAFVTHASAYEYATGCHENYDDCNNTPNLPKSCDLAFNFRAEMSTVSGWTYGFHRTSSTRAEHWKEDDTQSDGKDRVEFDEPAYADTVMWSGHGTGSVSEPNDDWEIALGSKDSGGSCFADNDQMKLGESDSQFGGDGDVEFAIMDASCSMRIGEIPAVWTQASSNTGILTDTGHQGFGFSDSPADTSARGEDFVENVKAGDKNQQAWLDAAECSSSCDQSPVVLTVGNSETDAYARANNESLTNVYSDPDGSYWAWTWINNDDC